MGLGHSPKSSTKEAPSKKRLNTDMEPHETTETDKILMAIQHSSDAQIAKMNELRGELGLKFDDIDNRFDSIESTVKKTSDDVSTLTAKMNAIEQDKLSAYMDITGVEQSVIDPMKSDASKLARYVITSLGIVLNADDIHHAYLKKLEKSGKTVIVVAFNSKDKKLEIMKKKRDRKALSSIYFDHSMTPATRWIYIQAKKKAKTINAKFVSIRHGSVHIIMNDGRKIKLSSTADLDNLVGVLPREETQMNHDKSE
jgi:hypothetical protein